MISERQRLLVVLLDLSIAAVNRLRDYRAQIDYSGEIPQMVVKLK